MNADGDAGLQVHDLLVLPDLLVVEERVVLFEVASLEAGIFCNDQLNSAF